MVFACSMLEISISGPRLCKQKNRGSSGYDFFKGQEYSSFFVFSKVEHFFAEKN